MGLGYYVALIAEARGYEVFPTADEMFRASPPLAKAHGLNVISSLSNRRVVDKASRMGDSGLALTRRRQNPTGFRLDVLRDPNDQLPPTNAKSLRDLAEKARDLGVRVTLRSTARYKEIDHADGLFLRCTNSYLYAMAAEAIGIPVIDNLRSILRCNNKAFVAEHLKASTLPHPKTILVGTSSPVKGAMIAEKALGTPLIIKHPSRSHGRGVFKAASRRAIEQRLERLSRETPVALVQEFLPSGFDWRIGVLNNAPLYACRYHMAPGYWKIIQHSRRGRSKEGMVEAVDLKHVPREIIGVAVRATEVIGQGLYGVDVKETSGGPTIMEINDNPDVNSGYELAAEGAEVWRRIVDWFLKRGSPGTVNS
jgi:glutathione synthase/RimK-type ligase-like ATP-grasp enzyme